MHIAYLSDELNIHDFRFLDRLGRSGRRTTLITFYNRETALPPLITGIRGIEIVHHRLDTYPDGAGARLLRRWRFERDFGRAVAILRDDLRRLGADVLHAGWVQTCGRLAARSGFHPTLLMPWGSDVLVWPDRSRRDRRRAGEAIRGADAITCDAEFVKRRIREIADFPAGRIVVFPWGVPLEVFNPGRRDPSLRGDDGGTDAVVFVATRQLKPVYGTDVLLDAFAQIATDVPAARLWIVGDGPEAPQLREMTRTLGIGGRVRFRGALANEDLAPVVASADVYVSASLSDGTSLSLLEAMACGLPAVVTDCPAILEWVTDGVHGRIAKRRDAGGLAAALRFVATDPAARRRMGEAALAVARERADWNRNFASLERIYDALAAGTPVDARSPAATA